MVKRVKVNNDCVDDSTIWVSSNSQSLYHMWLLHMKRRYPEFDIEVYKYIDKRVSEFGNDVRDMMSGFHINKRKLLDVYPELTENDPQLERWLDRKVVVCNRRKLTWIYRKLINDPSIIKELTI